MSPGRTGRVPGIAGIALIILGAVLCLDQLDLISLSPGLAAAAICAAAGFVLVVAGLGLDEADRDG